ncbi:MAG: DMT family transporter [Bilifractor sp.]|jgi:drug/metabolite transporter (DMT)-like permease
MRDKTFWTRTPVILLMTFICCFLWGSAFPCIKIGYRLFSIASEDTASQILFAGLRFTLAGILVMILGSIRSKKVLVPSKSSAGCILVLALVQTIGQYFFFYIGLAHASGVASSIIEASSNFLAILIAALVFRYEKLTLPKIIGCLVGFAGILLIQLPGSSTAFSMHWNGEGFILISATMYAFSSSLIKRFSRNENPLILSGCQFILGGLVLTAAGALMGGHLSGFTPASSMLLLYMALISAVAYSLWSILLKYNPVSRISVFGFMNPVLGVILSALLLNEKNQAFSIFGLLSLVLVSFGIVIVNRADAEK